ncbi:hypothetical protein Taro_052254 [Colocasia esculenta]|uniref:Uncharacterized protein n=1 Tax=Colocasia esculenta TaxID=4460 RepID=A0A843XJ67_COLES|nr:hypothetical protein [Colocasia esculenta]
MRGECLELKKKLKKDKSSYKKAKAMMATWSDEDEDENAQESSDNEEIQCLMARSEHSIEISEQFARMKISSEVNRNTLEHEEQMCVPKDVPSKAKWQRSIYSPKGPQNILGIGSIGIPTQKPLTEILHLPHWRVYWKHINELKANNVGATQKNIDDLYFKEFPIWFKNHKISEINKRNRAKQQMISTTGPKSIVIRQDDYPSQPNDNNNVVQEESVLSREDDDGCLQSYEDHVVLTFG